MCTYFVNEKKTKGSVTGLIHLFASKFDADSAIAAMARSDRWPRPGYVRPCLDDATLKLVWRVDSELLLALLDSLPNEPWICDRLQRLQDKFPDLVQSLTLNPHEIKCVWEANRIAAALSGTYMHYLFEAHVNGYRVQCRKQALSFSCCRDFYSQCTAAVLFGLSGSYTAKHQWEWRAGAH